MPFVDRQHVCGLTFVKHVESHETIDSTNDRAAQLAQDANLNLPTLVVARRQTAGRGRAGRCWWAGDGALVFSLLVDPRSHGIAPASWPRISLAAAVAVCDALLLEVPPARVGIKWPNDVRLDGRKVAGILLESPGGAAPAKDRMILGVGINVNNSWQQAPAEAGDAGVALCDTTFRKHDLQDVLLGVLQSLARRIEQLRSGDADLPHIWRTCCDLAGHRVRVDAGERSIEGRAVDITDDGALVVETSNGRERCYSGSVTTF